MDKELIERSKFTKTKNFSIVNSHWFQTHRNYERFIGDLGSLIFMAHHQYERSNKKGSVMTYDFWKKFYFESAKLRTIDPDATVAGRTPADFREIAYDIKKETYEYYSLALPIIDIEKSIIIIVLDRTYREYLVVMSALDRLKQVYPNNSHQLATSQEKHDYGVDIVSYNKELTRINALFTVKDQDFDFSRRSKTQPYLNEFLKIVDKHDKYYAQNKKRPQFLILDKANMIKSPVFNLNSWKRLTASF